MHTPFPTAPADRKAAHAQMVAADKSLMDEVAALRAQFPNAKMTHFKSGDVEYGKPSPPGWEIDQNLKDRVQAQHRKEHRDALALEAERIEKTRQGKSRNKSKKAMK